MKKPRIILVLFVALIMVGDMLLLGCENPFNKNCVGDGECYFKRNGHTKGCSNKSCIGNQPSAWFYSNEGRKDCNC